jgi:hypothetical protein
LSAITSIFSPVAARPIWAAQMVFLRLLQSDKASAFL